jgi:hypothetical protein
MASSYVPSVSSLVDDKVGGCGKAPGIPPTAGDILEGCGDGSEPDRGILSNDLVADHFLRTSVLLEGRGTTAEMCARFYIVHFLGVTHPGQRRTTAESGAVSIGWRV